MTLIEFIKSLFTDEQLSQVLENMGEEELDYRTAVYLVQENSWPDDIPYPESLVKVVDYNKAEDADHSHGQWNESAVLEKDGHFYKIIFSFYGQGDIEDGYENVPMQEVKPKTITKIIYEKI